MYDEDENMQSEDFFNDEPETEENEIDEETTEFTDEELDEFLNEMSDEEQEYLEEAEEYAEPEDDGDSADEIPSEEEALAEEFADEEPKSKKKINLGKVADVTKKAGGAIKVAGIFVGKGVAKGATTGAKAVKKGTKKLVCKIKKVEYIEEIEEDKPKKAKKARKKIRIWSFSRRLLAMCITPMVVTCVLITSISTKSLRSSIEDEIENAMMIAAVGITETYSNLYEGDYTRSKDGAVQKGGVKLNKTTLVDAMSEHTGYNVTMMFGNMRLLTTVKKSSGGRANGTGVDKELYAEIEKGEAIFLTSTVIIDTECYAYYEPLINEDGSVFGAVEIATDKKMVEDMVKKQSRKLVIFSIIIVILVCILVVFLSRKMVSQMTRIKSFLDRIIAGKLDASPDAKSLKANDELGDVYRSSVKLQGTVQDMVGGMLDSSSNLKVSAGDLSGMAQNTTYAADEVQQAVERISEGARSQANSTNEARQSVLRINDQIEQIIEEVDCMAANAEEMSQKEQESEEIINELSDSCDDTKVSVTKATEQIELMSRSITEIKDTITLIQSIADETDLLALNANIEAAKAGDAGRGFAVVADQISKLAIQSNNSSEEIQEIINKILAITETAVDYMGEVHANMGVQQHKLSLTKETYQEVANGVAQSRENMENIKKKINILNESGMSISNAIEQLSNVSEENANSAADTIQTVKDMNLTMQQVQESSEELLSMADALQDMMGEFEL